MGQIKGAVILVGHDIVPNLPLRLVQLVIMDH